MKSFLKKSAILGLLWLLLFVAFSVTYAQDTTIRIADDSSSGTYKTMLGELVAVCGTDQFNIQEVSLGGGAPGNLNALYINKADAAFLHSDVFLSQSQADTSYNRFKTLVALWPESIHVLVLTQSKTSKAGALSFGKAQFHTLSDLAGYTVGAAGGGVFTAKVLQGQGQGGFQVQEFNAGGDVIAALNRGDIAAAIFVGAAPLPNLQNLPNKANYRLIPIGETIANRVSGVYRQSKITGYQGLQTGPVTTLAPLAVILTKTFSTPAKINAQRALRHCVSEHLGELQDGYSPNWQNVTAGDAGTLNNYLDLGLDKTAPTKGNTARVRK